jgi:hypothetical protein
MGTAETTGFKALPWSRAYALAAVLLWAALAFGHREGMDLASRFFAWARQPGSLDQAGGAAGFARAELALSAAFMLVAVLLLTGMGWRLRRCPWRNVIGAALPWLGWLVLVHLAWKLYIVYASELVHFVQYMAIAALLAMIWRGREPVYAFLLASGLGVVDELWQHYGVYQWQLQSTGHWLDWSDILLDMLGAAGGVLAFTTALRLRPVPGLARTRLLVVACAVSAALLLPLLLLGPVDTSRLLGHYLYHPFWHEFTNHKPVHWPLPQEGVPVCLAGLLLLGVLCEPRQKLLSPALLAAVAALANIALDPPSRQQGQPVHEGVLTSRAIWTRSHISVDGVLDEDAWGEAPVLGPFRNGVDGKAERLVGEGAAPRRVDLQETLARVLWDSTALYLGIQVADTDIWALDGEGDELHGAQNEGIHLLIDEGNDEITYYGFSFAANNTVADRFGLMPEAPLDYNPWSRPLELPRWNATGLRSAVRVNGTLDVVESRWAAPARDLDAGYVLEIAIPWENFSSAATPGPGSIRTSLVPIPGERWRVGLYRQDYARLSADVWTDTTRLSRPAAMGLLGLLSTEFDELMANSHLVPPEDAPETYPRRDMLRLVAARNVEFQAWPPLLNAYFSSLPARFGEVVFVR